ncbi:MAG: hypothetical protein WD407_08790 [Rhodospirillales bacterium]
MNTKPKQPQLVQGRHGGHYKPARMTPATILVPVVNETRVGRAAGVAWYILPNGAWQLWAQGEPVIALSAGTAAELARDVLGITDVSDFYGKDASAAAAAVAKAGSAKPEHDDAEGDDHVGE